MKSYEQRKQEALEESPSMLAAFKRDDTAPNEEQIHYPRLDNAAEAAAWREGSNWQAFLNAPEGSPEELKAAKHAAVDYLIRTGAALPGANPKEQPNISNHFSEATAELYGAPEVEMARGLVASELKHMKELRGDPAVDHVLLNRQIKFMRDQVGDAEPAQENSPELGELLSHLKALLMERFGEAFDELTIMNKNLNSEIPAAEAAHLVNNAIAKLYDQDLAWAGWQAKVNSKHANSWSTKTRGKIIYVGTEPVRFGDMPAKFAHEVLGHALRAVNGVKGGDEYLEHGFADSLIADEGVAILMAAAVRGNGPSQKSKDYYMDTAMAMGLFGQPKLSRQQLQEIYKERMIIRAQARLAEVDATKLDDEAWRYVNRIYRGTLGNDKIGVNTQDTAYYNGFKRISSWFINQLKEGKSVAETFDYLTSANFDPTLPNHAQHWQSSLKGTSK